MEGHCERVALREDLVPLQGRMAVRESAPLQCGRNSDKRTSQIAFETRTCQGQLPQGLGVRAYQEGQGGGTKLIIKQYYGSEEG